MGVSPYDTQCLFLQSKLGVSLALLDVNGRLTLSFPTFTFQNVRHQSELQYITVLLHDDGEDEEYCDAEDDELRSETVDI
jgi:hypothetical protein